MPLAGTHTYLPLVATFHSQPEYMVGTYNGAPLGFAGAFGGQQTTNGALFAPGTAADLAGSLGVPRKDAAAAQVLFCRHSLRYTSTSSFDVL